MSRLVGILAHMRILPSAGMMVGKLLLVALPCRAMLKSRVAASALIVNARICRDIWRAKWTMEKMT